MVSNGNHTKTRPFQVLVCKLLQFSQICDHHAISICYPQCNYSCIHIHIHIHIIIIITIPFGCLNIALGNRCFFFLLGKYMGHGFRTYDMSSFGESDQAQSILAGNLFQPMAYVSQVTYLLPQVKRLSKEVGKQYFRVTVHNNTSEKN